MVHTHKALTETTTTTVGSTGLCYPFGVVFCWSPVVDMSVHGDQEHCAELRRRQRRLRMHWRHDQFTLQMLLATYEHHAAPQGQMKSRSRGGGERDEQRFWPGDSSPQGCNHGVLQHGRRRGCACFAARPTPLAEVRPQEWVQRHIAVHIVDILPYVQVPVP